MAADILRILSDGRQSHDQLRVIGVFRSGQHPVVLHQISVYILIKCLYVRGWNGQSASGQPDHIPDTVIIRICIDTEHIRTDRIQHRIHRRIQRLRRLCRPDFRYICRDRIQRSGDRHTKKQQAYHKNACRCPASSLLSVSLKILFHPSTPHFFYTFASPVQESCRPSQQQIFLFVQYFLSYSGNILLFLLIFPLKRYKNKTRSSFCIFSAFVRMARQQLRGRAENCVDNPE